MASITATETGRNKAATSAEAEIALYRQQQEFVDSRAFISGFVGGRGTGKSWVAAFKMLMRAKAGRRYMIVAPTYPVMMDTIWVTFRDLATQLGMLVHKSLSKPPWMTIRTVDGGFAHITFRSGDDPENLRGPNLSGVILEEAGLMQRAVLDVVMACLREGGELGYLDFVFTPKGKLHWTYSIFFDEEGNRLDDKFLSQARTEDNPFNPPGFAKELRKNYTSAMARQEIDGLFVDLVGLLFQREWFEVVQPEAVPLKAQRVRYWDKAATVKHESKKNDPDYSVGALLAYHDGIFYVEDVVRGQWSPSSRNKIMRAVAEMDARRYRNTVNIWVEQEPGSGGKESAILSVQNLVGFPVWTEVTSGVKHRIKDGIQVPGAAKITRALPFAAQAEHGNVKVVSARWNRDWFDEMMAFPEAVHDDQVDATSGAFNKLAVRQPASKEAPSTVKAVHVLPRSMQLDRGYGGRRGLLDR